MYATRSRRVKTDKRDARTLAEACKLGAYKPAHRTSDARRHLRARLAVREALVRTRTRYISLMRALVRREGFHVGSGGAEAFPKRLEAMALPEHLKVEVGISSPCPVVTGCLRRDTSRAPPGGDHGEGVGAVPAGGRAAERVLSRGE